MLAIEKRFVVPPPLTTEQRQAKAAKTIEALEQAEEAVKSQKLAEALERARNAHAKWHEDEASAAQRKRNIDEVMKNLASKPQRKSRLRKFFGWVKS